MTLGNLAKIEFLALPENVGFCRVAAAAFASQLDFTLDELEEIKVGVSEAITNAIIHGYQNRPTGIVRLHLGLSDKRLEIRVEDDGVGIVNVEMAMQAAYSTCEDRVGLGFSFMQSFMDELEVDTAVNQGTRITMKKSPKNSSGAASREN
ncbi:MAG: anti-sigma F factor [Firmicutes bacterium]|nr:anti-sigma F factor [Bacillota bacterium]